LVRGRDVVRLEMVGVLVVMRMLRLGTGMAIFVWWPERRLYRHGEEKLRLG
jgi:hypothetical protein